MSPTRKSLNDVLMRGVWRENSFLVQLLGGCSTLAVTNSVANSLAMGVATTFVLVCSGILVASLRKLIPHEVRITAYILIIATFVTLVDFSLEAIVPTIHKALGAFIALIVANCIVLGRCEAFAARNRFIPSALDGLGTGLGYTLTLVMVGAIRELLGSGSLLGFRVLGSWFQPWVVMVLPPGGFLTLGSIMLLLGWQRERMARKAASIAPEKFEPLREVAGGAA